jgi:predicted transcriptional regulator
MKVKKIKIKSKKDFAADLRRVAGELDRHGAAEKATGSFFESLDAVRIILTEKRLELWRAIRDQKPDSISNLARIVKRDFKSVHRDLLLLQSVGLISFQKGKGKRGDVQSPISLADMLQLEVA